MTNVVLEQIDKIKDKFPSGHKFNFIISFKEAMDMHFNTYYQPVLYCQEIIDELNNIGDIHNTQIEVETKIFQPLYNKYKDDDEYLEKDIRKSIKEYFKEIGSIYNITSDYTNPKITNNEDALIILTSLYDEFLHIWYPEPKKPSTMNAKRLKLSINKTAAECMPVLEHINLISTPFKYLKVKLIILEGMDCAGKETISKMLKERLDAEYPNDIVKLVSFPDYNTPSGKIIKELLTAGFYDLDNVRAFQSQMFINRADVIKGIQAEIDKEENKNKTLYLICDRFYMSHFIYNSQMDGDDLLLTEFNPLYRITCAERDIYSKWFNLLDDINENGVTLLFKYNNDNYDVSKAAHMEKLEKKEGKDSFETSEKQDEVSRLCSINKIAEFFYKTKTIYMYPEFTLSNIDDVKAKIMSMQLF